MIKTKISHSELLRMLDYDPETGIFIRKVATSNRVKVGDIAGCRMVNGYWKITLEGQPYYAHHLAWFYIKGEWPSRDIDHEDLVKDHNKFSNLRLATESQNLANTGIRSNNTSGFKGVHPKRDKWCSQIRCGGKRITLGVFETPEAAHAAYADAAIQFYGEFARAA